MSEEQKVPTKEEVVAFLKEQIEVKELQAQLQELNAKIAKARAEELQAISFVAQMTNPQQQEGEPYTLTEDDFSENPTLTEQGFKVGDEVMVPKEQKKRSLKKEK
jgi:hypothetical protein